MASATGSATARGTRRKATGDADRPDGPGEDGPVRLNLVVVCGTCSGPPELRELESGRRLAALAVRAPGADGRTTSVPVTVWDPAAWVEDLNDGVDLVIVGAVRRRFFRTGAGGAAARVDVEAVFVGRAGRRRDLDAARRRTGEVLAGLLE